MDPTIAHLLTTIDSKVSEVAAEVRGMRADVSDLQREVAVATAQAATVARDLDRQADRQAYLERELRAIQRRMDEAEGGRRAVGALGASGVVTGVAGLLTALWSWLGGGGAP